MHTDAIHNAQDSAKDLGERFDRLQFSNITVSTMCLDKMQRDEAFAGLDIKLRNRPGVHTLRLKVDTGAQGNTLPLSVFRRMYPNMLTTEGYPAQEIAMAAKRTRLTAYNSTPIPCRRAIDVPCSYNGSEWTDCRFYIVDVEGPAVIGLQSSERLKLVTLHCAINSTNIADSVTTKSSMRADVSSIGNVHDLKRLYPEQFDRIGCMPGTFKITVDPNAPAHVDAPRKPPIALKDEIKKELDYMEENHVIRKVTEPSDWVSSLAYSHKKDGSLRVCLDPRYLNRALKRPYHKIPTVEELTHHFAGAKVFSKLDAKAGYWSIKLDEESQLLTTFQSPFGRYCFVRLPFGLSVSQDIFQLKMDQILDQVDGAVATSRPLRDLLTKMLHSCGGHHLRLLMSYELVTRDSRCSTLNLVAPLRYGRMYSQTYYGHQGID
ncbi:PREDICTED: uncharacterized protein K02A2.6-like [Priapulus caudatus]|uniref:Uncharacterized protein K02A2.6-like n=1 Tax=Priapulus caudatus TaxID=37621 RepID=A0ABM1EP76_PRICU|nr:PREDICTED: uncharacterized protein K02A2.6-like [Priapulus caudatus]